MGGVCIAIFVLVHPLDEFTSEVMSGARAQIAPSFHFVGAALSLFGLMGVILSQAEGGRRLGLVGAIVAFFGMVWFAGLGLMSFAALPFIAAHAPQLITASGPFWNEPPNPVFLVGLACFVLGFVILGIALLRGAGLPRWSGLLVLAGAVLSTPPPVVVPLLVLTAGGVLLGAGLAWLGYGL